MKDLKDVWSKKDLQRCISDIKPLISKNLDKIFPNTEILVHNTINIRDWTEIARGSSINNADTQHLALVINTADAPFTEIVIGYWKITQKRSTPTQFVRQKTLDETNGTWNATNKRPVNDKHIYQVIAVRTEYQQCTSADGIQIDIFFDGFKNPKFKWSTQPSHTQTVTNDANADHADESPTQPDDEINLKLINQDDAQTSQGLFGDSQNLTQHQTQNLTQDQTLCGVDEEELTDLLHFYQDIDFNYLNEEKWPENMFSFYRDDSGKISYSGNTTNHYFTKVTRSQIIERKSQADTAEFRLKRGLQMDEEYQYFICPLDPEVQAKVYEETFMEENVSYLGQFLEKGGLNDNEFNTRLKIKVTKYYGFMEVFKMKKNGSQNGDQYEQTGKLNRLA